MKLADVLQAGLKEDQNIDEIQRKNLNEIEVPPDSTFVTNSIYWTVENLNIYKSKGSQQTLSQLPASKRKAGVNQSTRFSAALNRGGLYNQLNNQKESLSYLRIFLPKYTKLWIWQLLMQGWLLKNSKHFPILEFFLVILSILEAVVQRYSVKKVFLTILENSQEDTSARVSFSDTGVFLWILWNF